jgi:HPr kinase/phosphorylase
MSDSQRVHATTISLNGTAVMLRGGSGSGKSDLALQILETSGTGLTGQIITTALVADDQTVLLRQGQVILASAPDSIKDLLEVRGQGVLDVKAVQNVPLVLVVDLKPFARIERLPQPEDLQTYILGLSVPLISIDPTTPSAAARLRTAWANISKVL